MKTYILKIWRWKELLHEGKYDFSSLEKAQTYHLGLFNGFDLCGQAPTGMELRVDNPEDGD